MRNPFRLRRFQLGINRAPVRVNALLYSERDRDQLIRDLRSLGKEWFE